LGILSAQLFQKWAGTAKKVIKIPRRKSRKKRTPKAS